MRDPRFTGEAQAWFRRRLVAQLTRWLDTHGTLERVSTYPDHGFRVGGAIAALRIVDELVAHFAGQGTRYLRWRDARAFAPGGADGAWCIRWRQIREDLPDVLRPSSTGCKPNSTRPSRPTP